jgi:hypothetical protein
VLFRVLLAGCAGLAAVGFSRSAPSAWLAQGATGVAGALMCLLALRARELDKARIARVGGPPLYAAGALAALGVGLGVVELFLARELHFSTALAAGPLVVVTAVLTAVSALRLSTAHAAKRVLQTVAVLALLTAVVTTALYARSQHLVPPLPGMERPGVTRVG